MARNHERYAFLKWGQAAFDQFRVVPPGTGICHQVNLEYLATVVTPRTIQDHTWLIPDTLVGTDDHTTMVNALGVLGWGVGGIEAEAAMLGQPISLLIPEVIGVHLEGTLAAGVTATDLVLTLAQRMRQLGVVGKIVEFFGQGVTHLSLAERATLSNMAPEFGATAALFAIDEETGRYLALSGRSPEQIARINAYAKAQGLWHNPEANAAYSLIDMLNLATIEPSLAGQTPPKIAWP